MLPAANTGVGNNIGFPDVCNTPTPPTTTPIPYANVANNAQALGFSVTVKVSALSALNMASKIPTTMGDEAGLAHVPIIGTGQYTAGNPVVMIDMLPGINLACPSTGNNMNNALGAVTVPSAVNVMFCFRHGDDGDDEVDLGELGEVIDGPSLIVEELLPSGIGHLRLGHIGFDTPTAVHAALRRLEADGMQALLLDLRGNPGGELDAALRLADAFLPQGSVLATITEPDGETTEHRAKTKTAHGCPLVLLIDGGTASAAELVAACLKDHDRALLVGSRSYGKGSAQRIVNRPPDDKPIRVHGASWRSPKGRAIDGRGVSPHVPVRMADDCDSQLRTAWALALEMLASP